MTFEQAVAFLDSRIELGWKLGLDRLRLMMHDLGNPHLQCPFVHIAGTNGKGSVAAMQESIFRAAGYDTGLYTSPHLLSVRERIQCRGEAISESDFAHLMQRIKPVIETYNATYFETLTVLAFLYFAEAQAEIVLLEVGLGGRLDATNIVVPELCIITTISYDHTAHLGTTLPQIAAEKAGIVKPHIPCLIGEMSKEPEAVIQQACTSKDSSFVRASELVQTSIRQQHVSNIEFVVTDSASYDGTYELSLTGAHQVQNAALAISACEMLRRQNWQVSSTHIRNGLKMLKWPGRFQIVRENPTTILDVAHNEASINSLAQLLKRNFSHQKIIFVFGALADKQVERMCRILAPLADVFQPVAAQTSRAMPAGEVYNICAEFTSHVWPPRNVDEGLDAVFTKADEQSVICVTGSHYIVGEAIRKIKSLTN